MSSSDIRKFINLLENMNDDGEAGHVYADETLDNAKLTQIKNYITHVLTQEFNNKDLRNKIEFKYDINNPHLLYFTVTIHDIEKAREAYAIQASARFDSSEIYQKISTELAKNNIKLSDAEKSSGRNNNTNTFTLKYAATDLYDIYLQRKTTTTRDGNFTRVTVDETKKTVVDVETVKAEMIRVLQRLGVLNAHTPEEAAGKIIEAITTAAREVVQNASKRTVKEHEGVGIHDEYGGEAEMMKNQLRTIRRAATELCNCVVADEDIPEWMQAKITLAQNYVCTVRDVLVSRHEDNQIHHVHQPEAAAAPAAMVTERARRMHPRRRFR